MSASPVSVITEFTLRLSSIRQARGQLSEELTGLEASLGAFAGSLDTINQQFKVIKASPPAQQSKINPAPGMSPEDFKAFVEKILQGSLEAVGDKLSDKILGMIRELKGLAGAERDAKIQQIKEAADGGVVDLSSLFINEEVQSNLGEVGVEEKESKGIESSLEKLRKMRGKTKPGGAPEQKSS